MILREEIARDRDSIRRVHEAAFSGADEARLVDELREEGAFLCSMVAEIDGAVAGHILFTRMWIDCEGGAIPAVALAPMSVVPEYQRRGIGGQLIRAGLGRLRNLRERIVLVLGHEHYYPRFGFSAEKARNIASPFPPEAFMALELAPGAIDDVVGRVSYARAFGL